MTSFPEYYAAIGKPIQNGESYSVSDDELKILKCEENEYIDIKPEYKIVGAYVTPYFFKTSTAHHIIKQILRMSKVLQERNGGDQESH